MEKNDRKEYMYIRRFNKNLELRKLKINVGKAIPW